MLIVLDVITRSSVEQRDRGEVIVHEAAEGRKEAHHQEQVPDLHDAE